MAVACWPLAVGSVTRRPKAQRPVAGQAAQLGAAAASRRPARGRAPARGGSLGRRKGRWERKTLSPPGSLGVFVFLSFFLGSAGTRSLQIVALSNNCNCFTRAPASLFNHPAAPDSLLHALLWGAGLGSLAWAYGLFRLKQGLYREGLEFGGVWGSGVLRPILGHGVV